MTATAAGQFEFTAQDTCACGAALSNAVGNAVGDGDASVSKRFSWGVVTFRRCNACGTMVQSPRITTDSVAAWYDSEAYRNAQGADQGPYLDYFAEEPQRVAEAHDRYRRDLAPLLPAHARVLEIGCATGSLLAAIRAAGHDVVGVELSASFAEFARATHALELMVGDFNRLDQLAGGFDLVIMLGTVSNLPQLPLALGRVYDLLRDGGTFYFNVPPNDSWPARLYGERYWMYAPSACNFLSRSGLETALRRAGFDAVSSTLDRQRPTFAKLAGHLRLHALHPLLARLGLATAQLPVALPIPAVRCYRASKA